MPPYSRRPGCSGFLACVVPSGLSCLRSALIWCRFMPRSERLRSRCFSAPSRLGRVAIGALRGWQRADDGILVLRVARATKQQVSSDLGTRWRTARSFDSMPTVKPFHDPHTSRSRSEQGLPTPRCLCEEGSHCADLPSSPRCSRAHGDTGMPLSHLALVSSQLRCLNTAGRVHGWHYGQPVHCFKSHWTRPSTIRTAPPLCGVRC